MIEITQHTAIIFTEEKSVYVKKYNFFVNSLGRVWKDTRGANSFNDNSNSSKLTHCSFLGTDNVRGQVS